MSGGSCTIKSGVGVWEQELERADTAQLAAARAVAIKRGERWWLASLGAVAGVGGGVDECELALVGATARDTGATVELELVAVGKCLAVRGDGGVAI